MKNRLSFWKSIQVYWIAACETWRLSGLAFMPNRERESYVQRHVMPTLKQQTLAATRELSAGRRPYPAINTLIDEVIAVRVPELYAPDRA